MVIHPPRPSQPSHLRRQSPCPMPPWTTQRGVLQRSQGGAGTPGTLPRPARSKGHDLGEGRLGWPGPRLHTSMPGTSSLLWKWRLCFCMGHVSKHCEAAPGPQGEAGQVLTETSVAGEVQLLARWSTQPRHRNAHACSTAGSLWLKTIY